MVNERRQSGAALGSRRSAQLDGEFTRGPAPRVVFDRIKTAEQLSGGVWDRSSARFDTSCGPVLRLFVLNGDPVVFACAGDAGQR